MLIVLRAIHGTSLTFNWFTRSVGRKKSIWCEVILAAASSCCVGVASLLCFLHAVKMKDKNGAVFLLKLERLRVRIELFARVPPVFLPLLWSEFE